MTLQYTALSILLSIMAMPIGIFVGLYILDWLRIQRLRKKFRIKY